MTTLHLLTEYLNANDCEMRYKLFKGVRTITLLKRYQKVSFFINPDDLLVDWEMFKTNVLQPQMDYLNRML